MLERVLPGSGVSLFLFSVLMIDIVIERYDPVLASTGRIKQ